MNFIVNEISEKALVLLRFRRLVDTTVNWHEFGARIAAIIRIGRIFCMTRTHIRERPTESPSLGSLSMGAAVTLIVRVVLVFCLATSSID